MNEKMTKVLTLMLCLALVLTMGISMAMAEGYWNPIAGTSDWVALDGNEDEDGDPIPVDAVLGEDGLTITYGGGEYTAGSTNTGVMYAIPVDLSNFSVEFTVTKRADYYDPTLADRGCDSWISLCLLNKPDKYFNIKKAGESQGIVTLIRPLATHTAFEVNMLTNAWAGASRAAYEFPGDKVNSFKVEIKKGEDGIYDYIVNGVTVDFLSYGGSDFTTSFTRLMERGEVYFYMGVSSKDSSQEIQWTITKINGVEVKAESTKPTEPPTKPTEPPTQPTEPPTQPTEPPTQPTEPPTQPTEPPTQPTEPPTQPTEPPTQPTEPPTQPTEPPTQPTEPPTQPTEPSAQPTNPKPTEPKPTDPKPTEPDTQNPGQEGGFPWAIVAVIAVVVAVAVVVVVVVVKKKK